MKNVLSPSELKLLDIIWKNEPVRSGRLSAICLSEAGWKKSTVYTILKNLRDWDYISNDKGNVTSLISKQDYYHTLAKDFVDKYFNSSFAEFTAAYSDGVHLAREDILACYDAVKNYRAKF